MNRLVYLKNFYIGYLKSQFKYVNQKQHHDNKYFDFGILNPGIGTSNLGDLIIYDSIYKNLREIFIDDLFTNFPTQLHTAYDTQILMSQKNLLFVSGTNLLSSNLEEKYQWKIDLTYRKFLKNKVILFGAGWWQYQGKINNYTKKIYKAVFNKELLHSVRDNYTAEKLKTIGIDNVVNTSCPTLWEITPEKSKSIPREKSSLVVTTLTFYHKNYALDYRMLKILSNNYKKIYLWIQGLNDAQYFKELNKGLSNIMLLPPTLEAFDDVLENKDVDYIGTRLHAGIRALQKNRRTLILAVDNRAFEIGKDVHLNVIKREDVEEILQFINRKYETRIELPLDNIKMFKESLRSFK